MRNRILLVVMGYFLLQPISASVHAAPQADPRANPQLEIIAEISQGPGNITLTPEGKIIISMHQFYSPSMSVAIIQADSSLKAFPNAMAEKGADRQGYQGILLDSVLGIQSDSKGIVWMLDNGINSSSIPKLVAWDSRNGQLHKVIHLPSPASIEGSFLNDLAIDEKHQKIYLADPATGSNAAIIVVDIASGSARRVLEGHKSVIPEDLELLIDGKPLTVKRPDGTVVHPQVGINPIALDKDARWLYFGPMTGTSMYRVQTRDLLDPYFSQAALAARVERYSDKPISDGISIDRNNNIYITDVANNAIGVISPARKYSILLQDPRLSWPDAFSYGPDGYLYIVANQLHKSAMLNGGDMQAKPPFLVMRIKPLAAGVVGR